MEHVACRISCLAIGAVFLSLSKSCPEERRKIIFQDCKPSICIDEETIKNLEVKDIDDIMVEKLSEQDPSFIVYTSGTMGIPKGVLHNRSILECMKSLIDFATKICKGGSFSSVSDFMFVLSVIDISAVFEGFTFHIIHEDVRKNPAMLKKYFEDNEIVLASLLPSLLYYMGPIDCLKLAFIGGEICSYKFDNHKTLIYNAFAMSEAPFIAYGEAKGDARIDITLADGKLSLEDGVLCYSGPGIMSGYINKDIPSIVKNGVLHTGDMAEQVGDHAFVVKGRKDAEVKVNGKRVNTTEVEYYLSKIPMVSECAVIKKGNILQAYYSTINFHELSEENFEPLRSYLSDYAVPAKYIHVKVFDRNINGKIDKSVLGSYEDKSSKNEYVAPENDVEKRICSAFEKVLKKEKVGVNDSFVDLGGASIDCVALLSELPDLCISFNDVFEAKTPKLLAEIANKSSLPKFEPQKKYPLANTMQYMYDLYYDLDNELTHDYPFYTITAYFRIKYIRPKSLIKAFYKVLDAHPILKSKLEGDQLLRRDDYYPEVEVIKLDFEPDKEYFKKTIKPIDYQKDDLCRPKIYTYKSYVYFVVDINHMICDGYSAAIIAKDFISALFHRKLDKEMVSSFDYILKYKNDLKADTQHKFFKKIENGDRATLLPKSGKGNTKLALTSEKDVIFSKIKVDEICERENIPYSIFFMAALILAVSKAEGLDEVNFIYLYNGRRYEYLKNTVACLYEICPVFYKVKKNEDIVDISKRLIEICNENTRSCYAYELSSVLRDNANLVYNYLDDLTAPMNGSASKLLSIANKLLGLDFERLDIDEGSYMKLLVNALSFDNDNYELIIFGDSCLYGDMSGLKFCNYLDDYFNKNK